MDNTEELTVDEVTCQACGVTFVNLEAFDRHECPHWASAQETRLPSDPECRKAIPIASGFCDYFPDAMIAVAECSYIGNEQHNPGTPLHWDRSKSADESDALMRHFLERGTVDTDGIRHTTKLAWRAMALLQKELEDGRVGQGK